MEFLTILLSSLLTVVSPGGFILDRIAANTLRSQVESIEQLAIRIDNEPSYQILQGKVRRVRMAARGVEVIPDVIIDTLELETDPIEVNLERLQGKHGSVQNSLKKPLQGGVRIILTEVDLNRALQSATVQSRLQKLVNSLVSQSLETRNYELVNPSLKLLDGNRLRVQLQLRQSKDKQEDSQPLEITLEVGLKMIGGRKLELIQPTGTINGRKLSTRLLEGFAEGLNERLDLASFEGKGITTRVLQLNIDDRAIHLAVFFRINHRG